MPTFPANAQSANENPVGLCNGGAALWLDFRHSSRQRIQPEASTGWAGKGGAWNTARSTGTAIQGKWAYYVMTFNGTTLSVYATNGAFANKHQCGHL